MLGISKFLTGLLSVIFSATQLAYDSATTKFLGPNNALKNNEDYDYYVLSVQWGNTLCLSNAACHAKIASIPKNTVTLHGLWPSYKNGKMIDSCNTGSTINVVEDASDKMFTEMDTKWLSFNGKNSDFWTHEYNKHGLCYIRRYSKSGGYKEFFKVTMDLFDKYELSSLVTNAFGDLPAGEHSFEVSNLMESLQRERNLPFSLDCKFKDGKQFLQEIRFKLELDFTPSATEPEHGNCSVSKPIYLDFI